LKRARKKEWIFYIFLLLYFVHSDLFGEIETSTQTNQQLIKEMICKQTDFLRNISFQCNYIIIENYYKEGKQLNQTYEYHRSYIYKNGNYVRAQRFEEKGKSSSSKISSPKNLLELLALKINQDSYNEVSNVKCSDDIVYYYRGKLSIRTIYEHDQEGIRIWQQFKDNVDPSGSDPDPRCLIGFFGHKLFTDFIREPPSHISEYLNTPGKSFYYEENGYRILWHHVKSSEEKKTNYGIEIWVNSKGQITKMIEGLYFVRMYGEEKIKQFLDESPFYKQISHKYPVLIYRIYEWSNFLEIKEDVHIPLKCEITRYNHVENIPENDFLKERNTLFQENDRLPWLIISSALGNWIPTVISIIEINKETFKLDNNISDEVFIAPEPTIPAFETPEERAKFFENYYKEREEFKRLTTPWQLRYKSLFFIIGCVLLTLVSIIITKKYLGWGL